jgi:hypothetical protein
MSTPIPPNIKLEGIDLYAPRGAQTASAPIPHVSVCNQGRADNPEQPSEAATEPPTAADTPTHEDIGTAPSLPDQPPAANEPLSLLDQKRSVSASSLPQAANLKSVIEPSSAFTPPWLRTAPRHRLRLDPELVPPPQPGVKPRIVAPMLIVLMAGCAAVVGLTMISFQPDAHRPKRTTENIPTVAPKFDRLGTEPRLVVNFQKTFANEPLSLGISVDSATGGESLVLAGLALNTRLSAGVPVNEASWQLAPRDLSGVYVYAPKNFVGIMNTAVNLLSANRRIIESRAARLEWIAKSDSTPPTKRVEPVDLKTPSGQQIDPESVALMEKGWALVRSGDIASARLLFKRMANAGVADAALALAATYDPRHLAQHNLIGVVGDETKAHDWYQRANELGSIEAGRILARTNAD